MLNCHMFIAFALRRLLIHASMPPMLTYDTPIPLTLLTPPMPYCIADARFTRCCRHDYYALIHAIRFASRAICQRCRLHTIIHDDVATLIYFGL